MIAFDIVIPSAARNLLLFLTPAELGKYAVFPTINASLNGASAILLYIGHGYIKRGRMAAHRAFMIAAVATSSLFLACYLYFHFEVGNVLFQGRGWSARCISPF